MGIEQHAAMTRPTEHPANRRARFLAESRALLREFAGDLDSLARNFDDPGRRLRMSRAPGYLAVGAGREAPLLGELATVVEQAARRLRQDGFAFYPERVVALREGHEALSALLEAEDVGPVAARVVALVAARVRAAFLEELQ